MPNENTYKGLIMLIWPCTLDWGAEKVSQIYKTNKYLCAHIQYKYNVTAWFKLIAFHKVFLLLCIKDGHNHVGALLFPWLLDECNILLSMSFCCSFFSLSCMHSAFMSKVKAGLSLERLLSLDLLKGDPSLFLSLHKESVFSLASSLSFFVVLTGLSAILRVICWIFFCK